MSNMSYCRFENTNRDLADCEQALQDMIDHHSSEDQLSDHELRAAKGLVNTCLTILESLAEKAGKDLEEMSEQDLCEVLDTVNDECAEEEEESA